MCIVTWCVWFSCDPKMQLWLVGRFYLQLLCMSMRVCVFIHIPHFLWIPKQRKKLLLHILSLTISCFPQNAFSVCLQANQVRTSSIWSERYTRAVEMCRYFCCTATFNGANYIHMGDFQALEGILCIWKFFWSFQNAVFVSFGNGLEFGPGGDYRTTKECLKTRRMRRKAIIRLI